MFQTMTTKRNWESLSRLQLKDGALSDGSGGGLALGDSSSSILAHAAQQQARARNGGGDSDDDEDSRFPRAKSASNAPVNLLDALNGLNKLVSKQKRRDNGSGAQSGNGGAGKKSSIDDFLKKQNRDNAMARSKSQGMM